MVSCIEYLENTAKMYPQKLAVEDRDGVINFKDLRSFAVTLSNHLPYEASKRPIAVLLKKNRWAIISFFASLYSGNFYVPLDPDNPLERLNKILEELQPIAIITSVDLSLNGVHLPSSCVKKIFIEGIDFQSAVLDEALITKKLQDVIDLDPAYCIFTSGSTGTPKGVLISHRSVVDYINWASSTYVLSHDSVIGNQSPLYFDNSVLDIYLMCKTGALLVLIPEENFAFPAKLVQYILDKKITFIFFVPSVLVAVAKTKALDYINLTSLKHVLFAGEVMPAKYLNYWLNRHPEAVYSNLYGPTEITVDCTYYIINRDFEDGESIPIGVACRNTALMIIDERGALIQDDQIGELCIRGTCLSLGYWRNPAMTNKNFIQNPQHDDYPDLVYKTGDLVKRNHSGELTYVGRLDSQIKHNGYRIELGEIESCVTAVAGVGRACAIYSNETIFLFYDAMNDYLDVENINSYLRSRLPKYMLPRVVKRLDSMPLNSNGKIDRNLLKSYT
jgi:D-alanine--poly(phosphoribitol) ligase subunit 1